MLILYLLLSNSSFADSNQRSCLFGQCYMDKVHYVFDGRHYVVTTVRKYKSLKIINITIDDITNYINKYKIKHVSHIPIYLWKKYI